MTITEETIIEIQIQVSYRLYLLIIALKIAECRKKVNEFCKYWM